MEMMEKTGQMENLVCRERRDYKDLMEAMERKERQDLLGKTVIPENRDPGVKTGMGSKVVLVPLVLMANLEPMARTERMVLKENRDHQAARGQKESKG